MWPPQPAGARSGQKQYITIPKGDMDWKECCLLGEIKEMYNPEVVQGGLSSDGFNITVCPWFGNLVILRCQDMSEKVRCWNMSFQGPVFFKRGVDIESYSPTKSKSQHVDISEVKWASDGLVNVPILSAGNSITYPIDKELGST
ncbi:hypothetical protein V6N11_033216 [Hibiscus sabdariffa]|uniref:Uncharacterized protein n=1 Tax=Hibiscus sabdariffa TaxID=183260 RepID=A0ABR2PXD8_9ROSI